MYSIQCIYSTVCICVSSSLTISFPPRTVRQLMAGTHHIIMIIIQELTLSVCDLLLTPVQCYYHSLRSSDSVAGHLGIFSALFNEDSEAAYKQLYRGGLQEVCVWVCLWHINIHTHIEREACIENKEFLRLKNRPVCPFLTRREGNVKVLTRSWFRCIR